LDFELKGRTALVFGAGGGLGGAIAKSLAGEGANVVVADIDRQSAETTAAAIAGQKAGKVLPLVWDIADLASAPKLLGQAEAEMGGIDILINNTGGPPPTPASGQPPELWSKHFDQMVRSVIGVTDLVLPHMRAKKWGRIITSASSGVIAPIPNLGISNALRLALVGWSKTLAREVGRDGITANVVVPGRIATGRIVFLDEQKAAREKRPVADVTAESTATIPVGRYGDPQEYGDMVAFLASRRASYITGSVIRIDGGLVPSI
jgi:3-oxoacyl-[acyl-carrier protein] reductase